MTDWCKPSEYRRVGNGVDINVAALIWPDNSRGMPRCVQPVMAPDQDLSFDKLGVRTDGGHISDVNRFPARKYSTDRTRQKKTEKAFPKSSTVLRSPKTIKQFGTSGPQGAEIYADQFDGRRSISTWGQRSGFKFQPLSAEWFFF